MVYRVVILVFIILIFRSISSAQTVDFNFPPSVCAGESFNITNNTTGASTYLWTFCAKDLNQTPSSQNLGSFGGALDQPTYMDIAFANNRYYGFVTNFSSGNLIRLDFGNSLLNTPTVVNLGNINGLIPSGGNGGIQLALDQGKWYAIIVAGYPPGGTNPRIMKIDFGANIANVNPIGTNWGDPGGNMYDPNDLILLKEGNNWVALTVNGESNSISRFNFGSSLDNSPIGQNLGNIGALGEPTGLFLTRQNGNTIVFITNAGDKTRIGGYFNITRLNFGNSLMNTPAAVNLGNVGNELQHPHDIAITSNCNETLGFILNAHPFYNSWFKLSFSNNDITTSPAGRDVGRLDGFDYPYSIAGFYNEGTALIAFVVNKDNNTITRVVYDNCTNASTGSSTAKDPPAISYNQPGFYNIQLTVNAGTVTETTLCKQVVVTACTSPVIVTNDTAICAGTSIKILTQPATSYQWSPSTDLDNATAATPTSSAKQNTTYYVDAVVNGQHVMDSVKINVKQSILKAGNDTTICAGTPVQLNADHGTFFLWTPSAGLSNNGVPNPVATPLVTTSYVVSGVDEAGCAGKDTVVITVKQTPAVAVNNDTIICEGGSVQLFATGSGTYQWTPAQEISNTSIANPVVHPQHDMMYKVRVTTLNECYAEDSVNITVRGRSNIAVNGPTSVCEGSSVVLTATGGDEYQWTNVSPGEASSSFINVVAKKSETYSVDIADHTCNIDTVIQHQIIVNPIPDIAIAKTNDVNCSTPVAMLKATGAEHYAWSPAAGLSGTTIANPQASPDTNTTYVVTGTTESGCSSTATTTVTVDKSGIPRFDVPNAFTPNGDGKNDCFGIERWGRTKITQFAIFNRWGNMIFRASDPSQCWDGTWKGIPQSEGGYIYIIRASTICGEVTRRGMVTLIR